MIIVVETICDASIVFSVSLCEFSTPLLFGMLDSHTQPYINGGVVLFLVSTWRVWSRRKQAT